VVQEHVEGLGQILLLVRAMEDKHDERRQDKRTRIRREERTG
jgi:hypothetical protein